MESNRCLIFFIFGISLLPKIYSDDYPPLFLLRNQDMDYLPVYKFEYDKDGNVKYSDLLGHDLYNACPEKNASLYKTYALQVQGLVTDLKASSLQQFVKGDFVKYNCPSPVRPIVLKCKASTEDDSTDEEETVDNFIQETEVNFINEEESEDDYINEYDIGFLIHDSHGNNCVGLSETYEIFTEMQDQDYCFTSFLSVQMDTRSGMIISLIHDIDDLQLPEPDPVSSSSEPNEINIDKYDKDSDQYEKNINEYGFDVNSLYTKENQLITFSSIFGQSYSKYYDYPDQRLIKVQLAPKEDFLYHTWKLTTFVDLNTTAMWIQLHPQWKRVETFLREAARVYQFKNLDVQTGTSKVLTLADRPIYLFNGDKYPLTKYIWKLIKLEPRWQQGFTKAILIVMHNDPYTPDQKPICDDVSENWGWMVSNNNYKTGLTYVCAVHEDNTSKLRGNFKKNYAILNLNNQHLEKPSKIYSDGYPPLFLMRNQEMDYVLVHEFEHDEDGKVKYSDLPGYDLYNACPEENAPLYNTYALQVQGLVTDLKASSLQQFAKGDFVKYNCPSPVRPIVLKYKGDDADISTDEEETEDHFINNEETEVNFINEEESEEDFINIEQTEVNFINIEEAEGNFINEEESEDDFINEYDIGFLIHDRNGNCDDLSIIYEIFTEMQDQEYCFIFFLSVQMDTQSGMIISVIHHIDGQKLLEPDPVSGPSDPNEININKYDKDIDQYEKNTNEYGFDVNSLYTKENQLITFSSTFGQSYSEYYNYPDQRLIKVQLAPKEDFLYHTWKLTTFVDLNTTAMWIQLHPQWKRVETFLREAARQFKTLDVETGTSEVLTFANRPIYLFNGDKYPVTKYVWKLIKLLPLWGQGFTKAILIVMHNDPYTPDQKPICDDVSENWGWMVSNNDYKTGLTYVCAVHEDNTSKLRDNFKKNYAVLSLNNEDLKMHSDEKKRG